MVLDVDVSSAVPPYEQIRSQISDAVALGLLERGGRLPTIRQLAADLGLAPGTIARAYRELEAAGLIVSRGRHGTFVADRRATPPAPERPARERFRWRVEEPLTIRAQALRKSAREGWSR